LIQLPMDSLVDLPLNTFYHTFKYFIKKRRNKPKQREKVKKGINLISGKKKGGQIFNMEGGRIRKLPNILTWEERDALIGQPNPKAPTGLRNLCILRLMLDTGVTLSELLNLEPTDISFKEGKVAIRKEDRKRNRSAWVSEETLDYLKKWKNISPRSKYLFCTLKGGQLDGRYIREMVKRLARKAGICKNIFPHSLRHTFAVDLYRETKDIRLVQKALGHADISTTTIYTYLVEPEPGEIRLVPGLGREPKQLPSITAKKETQKPALRSYLPKYVFKCKCGEIVGRQMERCPGCGEKIEVLLEKIRTDFQRVNFRRSPLKK
jgi:integrase/recombinase XerD